MVVNYNFSCYRLDFETGIFIGPQADGTCVAAADSDLVTFTSPGLAAPPNLCGILTGSHGTKSSIFHFEPIKQAIGFSLH